MQERENGYFLKDDNIKVLFTKRSVDAKNSEDVEKICAEYGFNYKNLMFNTQVHGADVRIVKTEEDSLNNGLEADGLVTNIKKVPLLIFTADCVPLVFYDKIEGVVALAHAGWRGTFGNIAEEIVKTLTTKFSSNVENIKVIIGPSVSAESYEVSEELVEKFAVHNIENYYKKRDGSYFLDLWKINEALLEKTGIRKDNIVLMNLCTVKDNDKFFSYRLDEKTPKRIGTFIEIE